MSDCKMKAETSDRRSVQDMEKSYNDLHLSECKEQCDNSSASLCGDRQNTCHPVSQAGSSVADVMQDSEQSPSAEDGGLCGASSEPGVPLQGGAGGPGRAKAMTSAVPQPSAPDMMSMMMGGGMPFPDMLSMMSKGGMPPLMDKGPMQGGPMEMARMFNCIIDMTLAKDDSDESEDEDASLELPCQYCCRLFSNHMALKTHILVAHDQDDSVLNLTQLTISKKRNSFKDGSHPSCGRSQDDEAFASGTTVKVSSPSTDCDGQATRAGLAAAESTSVRGVKRGRIESKDLETVETGGASGVEDPTCEGEDPLQPSSQQESSAISETPGSSSDPETKPTSVESVCWSKPKRSKAKHLNQHSPSADSGKRQEDEASTRPLSCKDAVNKKLKTAVTTDKDQPCADRLDAWRDAQGLPAAAASGPAEVAGEAPTSVRRSLRSRSSNY